MTGKWISINENAEKTALYTFENRINLENCDNVTIKISADTRYILYINGIQISEGPAQSSAHRRFYEQEQVSEYLKCGENEICVKVLHVCDKYFTTVFPKEKPLLWFEMENDGANLLVSDLNWKISRIDGVNFYFRGLNPSMPHFEEQAAEIERIPLETIEYRETYIDNISADKVGLSEPSLCLEKRTIPQMNELSAVSLEKVQDLTNGYVLDTGKYTTAKIRIKVKGKKGDKLKLTYGECYVLEEDIWNTKKGVRDDKSGIIYGPFDVIELNGKEQETELFWYRAFRYIRVNCEHLADLKLEITANPYFYPLNITGEFICSDENYNKMWDVSINTLMCCMHEILVDCPYFEQQQYGMDSYLESMYSLNISNDTRLIKKTIQDISHSQQPNGLLCANYPARFVQIIPTFSIYWLMLLHDYYKYTGDKELVSELFGTVDKMLWSFNNHLTEKGVVKTKGWNFCDWVDSWNYGTPNDGDKEPIAIYSMQYSLGLKYASYLANEIGRFGLSEEYEQRRIALNKAIDEVFFENGYYKDTENSKEISQHTGMWAILAEIKTGDEAKELVKTILDEKTAKCSFSMGFFLFRALEKLGMYEKAFANFKGFQTMLDRNCTTWCENPGDARSECHGWSATPLYEFPRCILGVNPIETGYKKVKISPQTGHLTFARGKVATPFGDISVFWEKKNEKIILTCSAPKEIEIIYDDNIELR